MLLSALQLVVAGFVRRTWLVALVVTVACAGFAAQAVAALVEAEYLADAPRGPESPLPPPAPAPAAPPPDSNVIVERNIFCSACTPSAVQPGSTNGIYRGEPAVLIATNLGREPYATVRVLASSVQGNWELGATIPGVGRIDDIGPVSIEVVDADGNRGRISLLDTPAAGGPVVAATATRPPAADPFADRITKLSDTSYEVERSLVRELVGGSTKAGGARAFPVVKDGEVQGVRLAGVRNGSVASAIGLRSGDLISEIDGTPIKTAQQMLDLYAKLDQVSSVDLGGKRGGKPIALTIRLR